MSFQVRVTDPTWLDHLQSVESLVEANFWTGKPFKEIGKKVIFVRRGKLPRRIAGWGTLREVREMSDGMGDWDARDVYGVTSKDPRSRVNEFEKYMILDSIVLLGDGGPTEDDIFNEKLGFQPFSKVKGPMKTYHQPLPDFFSDTELTRLFVEAQNLGVKEGGYRYATHRIAERRTSPLKAKLISRSKITNNGMVICEGCNENMLRYGYEEPIVDCHHLIPISSLRGDEKITNIEDLALLCPNCHRAIHRQDDCSDLEELRRRLNS